VPPFVDRGGRHGSFPREGIAKAKCRPVVTALGLDAKDYGVREMRMTRNRTEKHEEARETLPDDLKPIFDEFVADYKYAATCRHGSPYVSYIVLADMVRAGWRPSAKSST